MTIRQRTDLRLFCAHALHRRTSGAAAQALFYAILAARLRALTAIGVLWIVGLDGNRALVRVARLLGGRAHGEKGGRGIVGFIVSPGVVVVSEHVDNTALREGWSDHPAYVITVRVHGRLVTMVSANLDKNRNGDAAYRSYLTETYGGPVVWFLQEVGHGLNSTRIRGWGLRKVGLALYKPALIIVGRIGVHRGVQRRRLVDLRAHVDR